MCSPSSLFAPLPDARIVDTERPEVSEIISFDNSFEFS